MLTHALIGDEGRTIDLGWQDGTRTRFHAMWLRDNALDDRTRSAGNGQRLITILDIPADTRIGAASIKGDVLEVSFMPEKKTVNFPATWLRGNAYDRDEAHRPGWTGEGIVRWTKATMQNSVPRAGYPAASRDRDVLRQWLSAVKAHGFAVMDDLPAESGALCKVSDLFGYIRETNYGRWFEVRAEVNPNNLAYTNLGLQAHTDNPYRDPVPTLQILSCIENTVEGGESSVVGGVYVHARPE
ncbi:TauD/TfdA family dioxygenase [Mesorhizobium sp. M1396]|uniref:TauD/TfdA family dioxygenase n=1 Tax=Mesorhizobium sp. M1396 TaxID=2957095 RepID=UPI003334C419